MNSRRLTGWPLKRKVLPYHAAGRICASRQILTANVRFGSQADICGAQTHVRFTPNSDRESRHPQTVMSALPQKRTCAVQPGMSAMGQKRTLVRLFDHLVSAGEQRRRRGEAE